MREAELKPRGGSEGSLSARQQQRRNEEAARIPGVSTESIHEFPLNFQTPIGSFVTSGGGREEERVVKPGEGEDCLRK